MSYPSTGGDSSATRSDSQVKSFSGLIIPELNGWRIETFRAACEKKILDFAVMYLYKTSGCQCGNQF